MFFHTQTEPPNLRAAAGLDVRGAAAGLWIQGGFLCFLLVLQQRPSQAVLAYSRFAIGQDMLRQLGRKPSEEFPWWGEQKCVRVS